MKTKKYLTVALLFALTLGFVSCGKYEEGPGLSLRTKKARISNVWKPVKVISNFIEDTAALSLETRVEFTRDDVFRIYIDSSQTWVTGEWEFSEDKLRVIGTYAVPFVGEFKWDRKIIRLTADEFWVERGNGNRVYYEPS